MPRPAADYLDGLIRTARGGDWKRATHKLFDFMRGEITAKPEAESAGRQSIS